MGKDTAAVAVVSDSMKDGRSTVASHIAFVKAQGGEKVVLVDGNLRSPSIHKIFNLSPAAGLSEYLLGERKMEEVITKTFIDNLDIITAGTASLAQPEHDLQSQRMTFLTKELMERYDFVIMDTPSFSSGTDAFIPATHMKKVLFVIRDGKNPQARVKECAERLGKAGIEITGVFLNGSRNGVPR
jgi:capsular exopolysaccharide synthesis family protein